MCSSLDRKSENHAIVFEVAQVGEFEMDVGRKFQIFGPRYEIVNCLIFVQHAVGHQL